MQKNKVGAWKCAKVMHGGDCGALTQIEAAVVCLYGPHHATARTTPKI